MQSSFPRLSVLIRGSLVLLTLGIFAACDRHPATEAGEGYGHGSSHKKSYDDHSIDSGSSVDNGKNGHHFSDTQGVAGEHKENGETAPGAEAAPAQKRFNN